MKLKIKVLRLECKMTTPNHILIEGTIDVFPAELTNRLPIYTLSDNIMTKVL